jgi:hypothetical protein
MSENSMYIGIGRPQEKLSGGGKLKEKIRKAFTIKGAEEAYREKHAKEIQEINDVNSALTQEERQAAMSKLENDAVKSARIKIATNYGALAVVTTAAVGETLLIANPKWASAVENFSVKAFGKDRKIFRSVGAGARKTRTWIDAVTNTATQLRTVVRKRAEDLRVKDEMKNASARARKLADALSGAIKLDTLDVLDKAHPATTEFVEKALTSGMFGGSELQNSEAEHLVRSFLHKAKEFGRWVPMVTLKGDEPVGFTTHEGWPVEGMGLLIEKGMVTLRELDDGKKLFSPTEKFVEFVQRTLKANL